MIQDDTKYGDFCHIMQDIYYSLIVSHYRQFDHNSYYIEHVYYSEQKMQNRIEIKMQNSLIHSVEINGRCFFNWYCTGVKSVPSETDR